MNGLLGKTRVRIWGFPRKKDATPRVLTLGGRIRSPTRFPREKRQHLVFVHCGPGLRTVEVCARGYG